MALSPGTRIGPYEIIAAIGAGRMGEVYRARDTKLNRDAAVKVLPAAFAQDANGVARLRREAQVLASLNHPHIAAIYGLEDVGPSLALALEFVEGDDLAERLSRGPIPLDDAIAYARQIVDALEAAHDRGIVHRDLKPANIKVTTDGVIKVLDFGLAKDVRGADPVGVTVSTPAHTAAGTVLGTPCYMSPEQARGKPVDKRTDIWAFGAVLFELLTGKRLFGGDSTADVFAALVTRDPDLTMLPASTPPGVRRLLRRCLERDPKKRLRDIGDARLDLDESRDLTDGAAPPPSRTFWRAVPWTMAAAAILLAGWASWGRRGVDTTAAAATYLDIMYPPGVEPIARASGGLALSPDGRTLAVIGARSGTRRLFIRRLDRPESNEVSDSIGVNHVAFSPDGASVAFVAGTGSITLVSLSDQQRKVLVAGADLGGAVGCARHHLRS